MLEMDVGPGDCSNAVLGRHHPVDYLDIEILEVSAGIGEQVTEEHFAIDIDLDENRAMRVMEKRLPSAARFELRTSGNLGR